jgi:hypothetical protein
MKKTKLLSSIGFALIMLLTIQVNAQKFAGLDKSPMDLASFPSKGDKVVKIYYSRPQLKGRSLSELTPNGKVWRTGANEATEITFFKDVNFGGKPVKAGTYVLATIPGEKEWTIILNSALDAWGTYSYDESKDVARVTVPVSSDKESLEAFSIAFDDGGTMYMGWDTLRVAVPIK